MILAAGCGTDESPDEPTGTVSDLTHHVVGNGSFHGWCTHGGFGNHGGGGMGGNHGGAGADGSAGKLGHAGADGTAGKLGSAGSTGAGGSSPSCPTPPSGMVSWWHADGNYNDAVGSNNGMSGGDVTFAAGEINQGFKLDGTANSRVSVPDASSLDVTGAITIDAWINSSTLEGRIVDKITAFEADGYLLDLVGGQLRFIVGSIGLASPAPLAAGVLTHVAAVFDGTMMFLYVNGMMVANVATGLTSIPVNGNPLNIGCDSSGGSHFTGIIDEPRIFNRALSAGEIAAVFQSESAHCQ